MPIIKSAIKRMRQTERRKARNTAEKRSLRAEVKALMTAVEAKNGSEAAKQLTKVQSKLDMAVKKNLLKKNTAARRLSSYAEKVKALGAKPAKSVKAPAKKSASKATTAKKTPAKKTTSK